MLSTYFVTMECDIVNRKATKITYLIALMCISFVNCENKMVDAVQKFYQEKSSHEAQVLTDDNVKSLAYLTDMKHFNETLDEILIPRVVGTPGHEKVRNYIVKQLRDLAWDVNENVFPDQTPELGTLNFTNIIAKMNPDADRYLVIACHYDSKDIKEYTFLGATDSAVPCAMMLNLAKVMSKQLDKLKKDRLSLMFIFFDGEEAFKEWGPQDSIYGARHLANMWEGMPYKESANHLQRMDMLVLLDLLGAPDPGFYSYSNCTKKWYVRLSDAETKLADLKLLQAYSKEEQKYFRLMPVGEVYIEDDHLPFLQKNVDILHIIPVPFPDVWHTANDTRDILDFNTIENLNKILRVFVAEYLHLPLELPPPAFASQ